MEPEDVKRIAKVTRKAQLEQRFLEAWRACYSFLPSPVMQFRFHDTRKWQWDFSWPDYKLAVEIDGGAFVGGGHGRGAQQAKDYDKMNTAVSDGWRVLRFNTAHMKYPTEVATFVAEVLTKAKDAV